MPNKDTSVSSQDNTSAEELITKIANELGWSDFLSTKRNNIRNLLTSYTKERERLARIAELWNPRLRIPENEVVIRERIDELENNHANG